MGGPYRYKEVPAAQIYGSNPMVHDERNIEIQALQSDTREGTRKKEYEEQILS